MTMTPIKKIRGPGVSLMKNERPRCHYLKFQDEIKIVPQIADFKHYFSVNLGYLETLRAKQFVCRIMDMFREDLSQRFASFLARIGLPEVSNKQNRPASSKSASLRSPVSS